jgi:hypothetical protein
MLKSIIITIYMLRYGSGDHQRCACPLNLLKGCPRVSHATNIIEQRAVLRCWGPTVGSWWLKSIKSTILAIYMLRYGSGDHQRCACPLNLLKGCPRVSHATNIIEQRAVLRCWGPTVGSWWLKSIKSTILATHAALRFRRPPAVRVLADSRWWVP